MPLELLQQQEPIKECAICQKPLGSESRDLQYRVCHEHRKCVRCMDDLYPREIELCWARLIEESTEIEKPIGECLEHFRPIHPRCEAVERASANPDPTLSIKQSEYDFLNLLRLALIGDPELSVETNENNAMMASERLIKDMDWDATYLHLKKLEACIAVVSIAVAPTRKELKAHIAERESHRARVAKKEEATSSRPVGKKPDEASEVLLAEFMRLNNIQSREAAKKLKRDRDKAILALTSLGIPEGVAQSSVDADLAKRGLLKG